MNSHIYCIT